MQNLSLNEIVSNIEQGICFEATHNQDFYIKIQEYVPFVCAAIHDGHKLRDELKEICLLDEQERLFEEDPFTGEFIQSLPITLIGGDSRYEYDLNRDEDNCIYDVAWGKKVWNRDLTKEEYNRSLQKHRNFYTVVRALLSKLEKDFKSAIVYDIHSYNFKRHSKSYLFNIGIENIDVKRYNSHISFWKKQLLNIKARKLKPEVSVNHIFYGRGQLLKLARKEFPNTLVLATEVKKVFMNEDTGEKFPLIVASLAKGLKTAILNNTQYYINSLSSINIRKKGSLLHGGLQPELLKLDKSLYQQLKNFELLNFVNPVNVDQEKKKFFKSNFKENPRFRYKPLTLDPFAYKAKMYQSNVDDLEDVHIRQIYIDIIGAYTDKVDMLHALGKEKFLYSSLRYFGEPSEKDIANAKYLLYAKELPQFQNEETLGIDEVVDAFEKEGDKYGFQYNLEIMDNSASDALVINSKRTVYLKRTARFTPTRLRNLLNHEIGVHMVTTMNANNQPLKFLSLGLPRNTYTQEGLAIMAELFSSSLSVTRLRELALRVLAVDSLAKGNDFKTTFQMLMDEYKEEPNMLYYLVTRVYRGGGFTKDYLYLRGFRKLINMHWDGVKLDNLFLGKVTHSHLTILNELVDRGILNPPKYKSRAFENPSDIDPVLNYLIQGLKN